MLGEIHQRYASGFGLNVFAQTFSPGGSFVGSQSLGSLHGSGSSRFYLA